MTKIHSINIPKINLIKIINKEYFYALKKEFIALSLFKNQELYEDFMNNPNPNLKSDKIIIFKSTHDVSEEYEKVDKHGTYHLSESHIINTQAEEVECDFYLDFLIPGIEKGKKAYLLDLKKSLINADRFKDEILLDFFSKKKSEIRTAIDKATQIKLGESDFNIELEKTLYEILCKINSYEQIYFPIDKIHLNLDKVQVLFLFHALSTHNIIKGLNNSKLFMLVEKYFTYGKDNLPISDAYKSLAEYALPKSLDKTAKKTSNARKKIGKKSLEELDNKFEKLFHFLKK